MIRGFFPLGFEDQGVSKPRKKRCQNPRYGGGASPGGYHPLSLIRLGGVYCILARWHDHRLNRMAQRKMGCNLCIPPSRDGPFNRDLDDNRKIKHEGPNVAKVIREIETRERQASKAGPRGLSPGGWSPGIPSEQPTTSSTPPKPAQNHVENHTKTMSKPKTM